MNVKCFLPADILIPENTDMSKWSVIACDQYTSQPEYWEEVAAVVGNAPSAFNVILPEAYLDKANTDEHIAKINRTMYEYMKIMKEYKNAFIYVERTLKNGKTRCGLIGMVDLEEYDFSENSSALIRATEGTVLDRIPPRLMVRRDAPLELPHVMLLANDPERTIIEPLSAMTDSMQKIYDFELMQRGGHIKGYLVPESYHEKIINAYAALADVDVFNKKNKTSCTHPLLFAAGDGNHSLATAKTCYESLKKTLPEKEYLTHPSRYALVELVNIHDKSLEFEAIHRVLFGVNAKDFISEFLSYCKENTKKGAPQKFIFCHEGAREEIVIDNPPHSLGVGTLQNFIDGYVNKTGAAVDYIHGEEVASNLGSPKDNLGIILEPISRSLLFQSVAEDGALPRKTFSMGEADEKRFYLEARRIKEQEHEHS